MENNATMGLLLFLVVLAFPVLAFATPFLNLWYARNQDQVKERVASVQHQIEELKERRDAAYREDEEVVEE
jgi:hypothetical protein